MISNRLSIWLNCLIRLTCLTVWNRVLNKLLKFLSQRDCQIIHLFYSNSGFNLDTLLNVLLFLICERKWKYWNDIKEKYELGNLGNYPGSFAYRNKKSNSDRATKQAKCTANRKLNLQFFLPVRTWYGFCTSVVAEHNFFDICVDNLSFSGNATEAISTKNSNTNLINNVAAFWLNCSVIRFKRGRLK